MSKVEQLITEHIDIWTSAILAKSTAGRGGNKKYELYGIKKLRELILELAVRGKLVPQDSSDEPASVLLERIAAEKAELMKEGKIKKSKPLPEIVDEEKPFDIPSNWDWTQLCAIAEINPRNDVDDNADVSFVPMTLVSTSYKGEHESEIKPWGEIKKGYTHFADGDIAIAKITPCFENSKAAIFSNLKNGVGAGTTELHVARPIGNNIEQKFVLLYLKSPKFLAVGEFKMTGSAGQKRVPKSYFEGNPLPIPPLLEQQRIVAKVDELMLLCDQLEQQTETSIDAHATLVEVLLATLTDSADANELAQNWARVSEHFDTLFTTEQSIEALKQTLLQLAVMGKLVPQDPNDEPATVLLEKLRNYRNIFLKEKEKENPECKTMLNKLKKLGKITAPFKLPSSWITAHLIDLSFFLVDCHNKTAPYVDNGIPIIRTSNIREREFLMAGMKYITEETYQYWSKRCPPEAGDIIFTREAPMGEAAIIPAESIWCLGQRTMLIRPVDKYISNRYLLLALTEPHLLERASEHAVGSTVKHLRVGDVEKLNIPLPPLEEQYRIVAKVDELMKICEQLKTNLQQSQETQVQLTDALIEQALA